VKWFERFAFNIFFRLFASALISVLLVAFSTLAYYYYTYRVELRAADVFFFKSLGQSWVLVFALLLSLSISIWIASMIALPLGRTVRKARRISSKKWAKIVEEDDYLFEEEVGEFYALERALDKIARKHARNKKSLYQIQEEANAFMTSIDEGVITLDLSQHITYFNTQFASRFVNVQRPSSVLLLAEVFRIPDLIENFDKVLKSGIPHQFVTKLMTLIDSEERYFKISVTPLRNQKTNEIYGLVGIFSDVTELKKTAMIRMDFVTNASHELRTPLTNIQGYLETLKEDFQKGDYEAAHGFLNIVSRNVDRLQLLMNDLLTLSQLESSSGAELEDCDPSEISQHAISQMLFLAGKKEQTIQLSCSVSNVRASSRQLEQVLLNLISNAIKYSPEKSIIKVIWQADNDCISLIVEDQGMGISKEHQSRLFERFYRVDSGRSRDAGGTGLGLSIVKHIMMNHHGTVFVQSDFGHGSKFICSFPK
jgi:two-component system, OmpR family, phosphate regulon sensor histidine kinase PhoR